MALKVAFQMDPIERIDIRGDSTFALLLEAQWRGHDVFYYTPNNLSLRDGEKGLSTGEKQMYVKAKKILASELMYAKDMDEETCADWLEEVLASDSPPKKKPAAKKKATAAATA